MSTVRPFLVASLLFSIALCVARPSHATVVTEPPDLSNSIATAPVIVLTSGANTVSGMVSTPSDGQDNFQVTVPAGFRLTAAALTLNTSGGFNGFVTFNLSETLSASGSFTLGLPLSAGTYYVQVIANFSVGNAWSMSFTLTPFAVCGNGVIESGETCDDGNTTGCDGCSPTCTAALNGCLIGGVCIAEGTVNPANACTVCARAVSRTSYSPVAAGTSCNDGNACTQVDTCQAGVCTGSNPVTCTAADQCHVAGVCNAATGACSSPVRPNGTACNDGSACTQTDTCQAGLCIGANPVTCTAADQCHMAGACNPATGVCSAPVAPNGTACNDGNACSQTDTCQTGVCTGANPVTCTATTPCHVAGVCNPATGVCTTPVAPNGTACNDGNACTQTDTCQTGTCAGANPVTCTAADQCHVAGVCNPATGVCSAPVAPNGSACNDGNACSQSDTCQTGVCTGANPVTCTPGDACHVAGVCNPATGACTAPVAAAGTPCNDGLFCTAIDTCNGSGACTGTVRDCSDALSCTADACDETSSMCVHPVTTGCLIAGACVADGSADPSNACVACRAAVSTTSYSPLAVGTACDDGLFCTAVDTCNGSGVCTGAARDCSDSLSCTSDSCDETASTCVHPVTTGCLIAGACVAEGAADPGNACVACLAAVSTSSFSPMPTGSTCNDGLFCTAIDTCDGAGICAGTARDCSDSDACTTDTCDETAGACSSTLSPSCADAGTDAGDAETDAEAGTDVDGGIDASAEGGATDGGSRIDTGIRDAAEAGPRGDATSDGSGDAGNRVSSPGCGCRTGSTSSGTRPLVLALLLSLSLSARRKRSGRSRRR